MGSLHYATGHRLILVSCVTYRERLKGKWGVMDVEDCVYAVKELVSSKYSLIDPDRVVIRGNSAGG